MKINTFYIYDSYHIFSNFKSLLVLRSVPGIRAAVKFTEEQIYLNGTKLEDQCIHYEEKIKKIKKNSYMNLEFFGIISGKDIVKQDFIKEPFKFNVYAIFNHAINQWLLYNEIQDICKIDQKDRDKGITKLDIKPLDKIGIIDNDYNQIKEIIKDENNYSIFLTPYPDNIVLRNNEKQIIEYPNPIYQEEIIDKKKFPSHVLKNIENFISTNISEKKFHTILAKFAIDEQSENLSDLRISNLEEFQHYFLKKMTKFKDQFPSDEIAYLVKQNIKLELRKKYIDFLINYILV